MKKLSEQTAERFEHDDIIYLRCTDSSNRGYLWWRMATDGYKIPVGPRRSEKLDELYNDYLSQAETVKTLRDALQELLDDETQMSATVWGSDWGGFIRKGTPTTTRLVEINTGRDEIAVYVAGYKLNLDRPVKESTLPS